MKQPMKLTPAEFATVVWHITMPAGQSLDDALKPSYWEHVAGQLKPGHEVKVSSEDRTFWAHLFVRDVSRREATMGVINKVSFGKAIAENDEADTFIKWRGPQLKFGVFPKEEGADCLQDGFETKEAALVWATQRQASLAA